MRWFGWLRRKGRADTTFEDIDDSFTLDQGGEAAGASPRRGAGEAGLRFHGGRDSAARTKLRTAFTPSQPVSDLSMFAGRRELMASAIRAIEDQQLHVVLYGERGIGKTSMLHMLTHLGRQAGYVVRYSSCGEDSRFSDTFRAVARDIPLIYHDDIDPTSERAEEGGSLSDLAPDGELSVAEVTELFAKLVGARVIVILDEFDRSNAAEFRPKVAQLIKGLSDRAARVQLVIAGVADNLLELIEHLPSIRRNIFGLPVTSMTDQELGELIRAGAEASGIGFGADVVARIVHVAHGSPYLANLIAQHAGIAALDRGAGAVTLDDVALAIRRAAAEMEQRLTPQLLHDLSRIKLPAMAGLLEELADEALGHGGRIAAGSDDAGWEQSERLRMLQKLETDFHVIRATPNRPDGGYEFEEDGLAPYLWLKHKAGVSVAVRG